MENEKLNKNYRNPKYPTEIIKKINFKKDKLSSLLKKKNSLLDNMSTDFGKITQIKRSSKKNIKDISLNNYFEPELLLVKSQKNLRKNSNFNLTGFSLHDALYLGLNLNNKGIRTNDVSCYLSSTSYHQPEDTKYKLIEKNIQNKILDISMEILDKQNSKLNSEIKDNDDNYLKLKPKKPKKTSKKMISTNIKKRSSSFLTILQKSPSMKSHDTSIFIYMKEQQIERIRKITRKKALYDSMAEDESDENLDDEGFSLSPETIFIDIYDCLIFICSLFCLFYIPIRLAMSKLNIREEEYLALSMIYFSEIIYIIDFLFGFFRGYYNNELKLVMNNYMIIKNFIFSYFLLDLTEAFPFYTILKYCYLKKEENIKYDIIYIEEHILIKIMICFKALKIFKINNRKTNRVFYYFNNKFSENYLSERIYQICNFAITTISVLNIFICFHIYMGKLSYPNWIISSKLQDKSFIEIYLSSLYFILATMTSVGYGDIVCISRAETFFQIILLSIGIVAYSWIISTVGDYVKNESRATIKYNKDIAQLEEIRIAYPNMPFKLYNKIHQHLYRLLKQQEKYDSNLLINSLPLTIKNNLLFEIHKEIIRKFIFFHGCENSDFILKILTHFIPLYSKKNAFLIKEGEIIENIFFVKDGRLSLEAAIDLDNIEESVEKYLEYQFEDISSIVESSFEPSINKIINEEKFERKKKVRNTKELFNLISRQTQLIGDVSYMHESNIEGEIGKCDLNGENEDLEQGNHQFLHILDILKNEHFGELYMFLNKPCPLSLRVKSKKVDLFLLRKKDAINIKKDYPNIWKRIDDKSMHNMKSIKALTKRVINNYCKMNGILHAMEVMERSQHLLGGAEKTQTTNNSENNSFRLSKIKKHRQSDTSSRKNNKIINNNSPSASPRKKINDKRKSLSVISKHKVSLNKIVENNNIKKTKSNSIIQKKNLNLKNKKINESDLFQEKNILKENIQKSSKKYLKLDKTFSRCSSLSLRQSNKSLNKKLNTNNQKTKEQEEKNESNKNISHQSKKMKPDNIKMTNPSFSQKNVNIKSIDNMSNKNQKNINSKNYRATNSKKSLPNNSQNDNIFEKNKDIYNNKKILYQESTIKIEIISSYKNINKLSRGNYIKNKQFQKATQRFVNYYINSILKQKNKINDINNKNDSSVDVSSFKAFSLEESSLEKSKLNYFNNINIDSQNKNKAHKNKHDSIKNFSSGIISHSMSNNSKIEAKDLKSQKQLKNHKLSNKNKMIVNYKKLKSSYNVVENKNSYNSFEEEKENNKEKDLFSKNCNSDVNLSNNNSNFLEIGKNILLKKQKIEDINKLNKKIKEDRLIYNSSKNIINNKSNKNINEVNINFTNNFCNIF